MGERLNSPFPLREGGRGVRSGKYEKCGHWAESSGRKNRTGKGIASKHDSGRAHSLAASSDEPVWQDSIFVVSRLLRGLLLIFTVMLPGLW